EVWATLRTRLDERMDGLVTQAEALARGIAADEGLACSIDYHEIFVASLNAPEVVERLRAALDAEGGPHSEDGLPMGASDDFGTSGHTSKSAMFCLGAGDRTPALHSPDYGCPDDLSPIGAKGCRRATRDLLG